MKKRLEFARGVGFIFAATIFLSAFLLFQVQPLISKSILPWFGGTPAVWTTCMLFFQVVLFGGYVYAHVLTQRIQPKRQVLIHLGLLVAALALLPISPSADWKPDGTEAPTLRIVLLLAATVGLPFFALSTTGPLLQHWYSRTHAGSSPYRLYALSNAGSLIALVSYPFVVEPALATSVQAGLWSAGFIGFAALCTVCAYRVITMGSLGHAMEVSAAGAAKQLTGNGPESLTQWLWFGLAMTASVMLLATTNQVCMDVASVPFLWVAPLTLYLLSFILCFDSDRWYRRKVCFPLLLISFAGVFWLLYKGGGASLAAQIGFYFSALFFAAMVCHGELVRLKPEPRFLTRFYLAVSAGGAAGGLFVAVVAPLAFSTFVEFQIGILATCVLPFFVVIRELAPETKPAQANRRTPWVVTAGIVCVIGIPAAVNTDDRAESREIAVSRNFYGVLRVTEHSRHDPERHRLSMLHGRIVHGLQFADAEKRSLPTTYYGDESGVGLVLGREVSAPRHVGAVGLGVGTIGVYAREGDRFQFYEINEDVIQLANEHFTFLKDCEAQCETVLGDARLSLERQPPQNFDVLVLDAFSGDAIPVHLLTVEAGEIYLKHLKADGVLAVHISNMHFDLRPVVAALADRFGLTCVCTQTEGNPANGTETCRWMLMSRNPGVALNPRIDDYAVSTGDSRILFSDDDSNLFEIMRSGDEDGAGLST